mmetsp:Transcript_14536/g.43936  ORF Transcript_14536/g.43936 Transcript_14536/m.43936 type:complete len:205 (+) Transcript_14536:606-1220(+)
MRCRPRRRRGGPGGRAPPRYRQRRRVRGTAAWTATSPQCSATAAPTATSRRTRMTTPRGCRSLIWRSGRMTWRRWCGRTPSWRSWRAASCRSSLSGTPSGGATSTACTFCSRLTGLALSWRHGRRHLRRRRPPGTMTRPPPLLPPPSPPLPLPLPLAAGGGTSRAAGARGAARTAPAAPSAAAAPPAAPPPAQAAPWSPRHPRC